MKNTIKISKLKTILSDLQPLTVEQESKLAIMSGKDEYGMVSQTDTDISLLNSIFMRTFTPTEPNLVLHIDEQGQVSIVKGKEKFLGFEFFAYPEIDVVLTGNETKIKEIFGKNAIISKYEAVKAQSINWDNVVKSTELKKEQLMQDIGTQNIQMSDLKKVSEDIWTYDMFKKAITSRPNEAMTLVLAGKFYASYVDSVLKDTELLAIVWSQLINPMYSLTKNIRVWRAYPLHYSYSANKDFVNQLMRDKNPYLIETIKSVMHEQIEIYHEHHHEEEEKLKDIEENDYRYKRSKDLQTNYETQIIELEKNISILNDIPSKAQAWEGLYFEIEKQINEKLTDKAWLISNPTLLPNLYSKLSKELKLDKDIVRTVLLRQASSSYYSYCEIDKDFYQDVDNCILFWGQSYEQNRRATDNTDFVASLGKKKVLLDFLSKLPENSNPEVLFSHRKFPERFRTDEAILTALLDRFPDKDFFTHIKKDIPVSIIDKAIIGPHPEFLPNSILFLVEDRNIIKKCVENKPEILNEKHCPKRWRYDTEILMDLSKEKFKRVLDAYKANDWQKMFAHDVEKYKLLLDKSTSTFRNFPLLMKNHPSVFGHYAEIAGDGELDYFSQSAYCHKPTLYKLLERSHLHASRVPVDLWKDKEFVMFYAVLMDREDGKKYYDKLPFEIKNVLNINDIKAEYEKFFLNCFMQENMPKQREQRKLKI